MKSMLSNRGLGINAKKCPDERVIVPTGNGVVRGRGIEYEKCSEKESECS